MKANLNCSREDLSDLFRLSLSTVKRAIKELTDKGYISGKTSNKSATWIIKNRF